MDKFLKALFSMRGMALGMLAFLSAIAIATFIESSHGTQAAKILVYNALWFELLLAYLGINLIANIFRYRMWQREKISVLAFHLAFIIILIGAAITRFTGFEGLMLIREGQSSSFIWSSDPYLYVFSPKDREKQGERMYMSEASNNDFTMDVPFRSQALRIDYVDFMSKRVDSLIINDSIEGTALDIVTNGKKSNYLVKGDVFELGDSFISYEGDKVPAGINIYRRNGALFMRPTSPVQYLAMSEMQEARKNGTNPPDSAYKTVPANTEAPFLKTTLYMMAGQQFVFRAEIPHAAKVKLPSGRKDVGSDYLVVKVSGGGQSKTVMLQGGMGVIPTAEYVTLNGTTYALEYGAKRIDVPFSVKCLDFIMQRYPGSDVASAYSSDLQILDSANNYFKKRNVFMNNVLDYNGYRFFQSGYDDDEKGTRLSVNHDEWGTNVTYLGYLMMAVGMILSLAAPAGRFRELINRLGRSAANKAGVMAMIFALSGAAAFAQDQTNIPTHDHEHTDHDGHDHGDAVVHDETHTVVAAKPEVEKSAGKPIVRYMSEEHSEEIAKLLVEDFDGRIVPLHTMCDQILRKVYRGNKYEKYNAVQTVMSMHMYRDHWRTVRVIQVPAAVRDKYGLGGYASFDELTNLKTMEFKWLSDYNAAMRKSDSQKSETEKKLIKLVEKYEVVLSVFNWAYLKIVPIRDDHRNLWTDPISYFEQPKIDTAMAELPFLYFSQVHKASADNNYREAVKLLGDLMAYQRETAPASILPSATKVSMEISYNKMNIFKNAQNLYGVIGFVLLIIFITDITSQQTDRLEKRFRMIRRVLIGLLLIAFIYHGAGLGMRWFISGHVPWSNGYEALTYIAWAAIIAGLLLSRFNKAILPIAAILAYFILFVTEMNLLDPEITPLQPVLKSYWLMIHVAIITASYAFLGLAAMIGIVNMVLYLIRTQRNGERFTQNIGALTYVSEMTMTIGLFMLTIGTFLGGIWANESWGRYWGWDPKETWALVSVLVYAIILHFRYIPGLKGKFTFNVWSLWGYSAILFTFFGVNFILVGLHSYAQGDGAVSLPSWVIVTVIGFLALTIAAAVKNSRYKKQQKQLL
jgi:cytochrome c-type biogenesis protein CcsB